MFSHLVVSALAGFSLLPSAVSGAGVAYSYDDLSPLGPSHWGQLTVENNQCSGTKNSPVAIESSGCDEYSDYTLTAGTCTVDQMKVEMTENGVKASYPSDGSCTLNTLVIPGVTGTFQALQFHIHMSSEHTIDGAFFGAELHVVHKQTDAERYAVVGTMIEAGAQETNALFQSVLDKASAAASSVLATCANSGSTAQQAAEKSVDVGGVRRRLQSSFNVYELLKSQSFYHYDGGLTTPPCSEVVWWNLADKPFYISTVQYQTLARLTLDYVATDTCQKATVASPSGSTSRPVQPLHGRIVKHICPASANNNSGSTTGSGTTNNGTTGSGTTGSGSGTTDNGTSKTDTTTGNQGSTSAAAGRFLSSVGGLAALSMAFALL